ncbi:peptide chain release factor N(5)-glutamine methyltransferase [Vibrio sp.]|nr:peptide chain release factor N(5)-glutamine methyltransferase [Vibrio sp.]
MTLFEPSQNWRIDDTLAFLTQTFSHYGGESPSLDASVLLCFVLDKPRSYLLTWPEKTLLPEQIADLDQVAQRRCNGEPVAYILGEREFWSLPLNVSPSTLIPRPDTERLVELALEKALMTTGALLDLGTGTGAIALALASELPQRRIIGIDLKEEARDLAQSNADKLNIKNASFLSGSWFSPLTKEATFSVIVSNPPYIDKDDPHLALGDVRFEPLSALVADDNGLADIKHISHHAISYIELNGWLLFEHGYDQGNAVRDILIQQGYHNVKTEQDYGGRDRVTIGQWVNSN